MMLAAAPTPAPKPGRIKVYRALYDYTARSDAELSLKEGDVIYVTDATPSNGWVSATIGGQKGYVPVDYVISENVQEVSNPLHEAAKRGNIAFLQECLHNQVSVNSLDKSGSTALYWASHGGHVNAVQLLLAVPNVSISSQNKIGDTALHAASWRGHADVVKLLLEAGANPRVRNQQRKLPSDEAKDTEVAALLQSAMKSNTVNEDEPNEYASDSDE